MDNPARIREIDRRNMLSFCVDAYQHYERAANLGRTLQVGYRRPKTIVVAGMGGSAIGGELLKDWARDRAAIPIEVCREYSLPKYADKDTLVCVVSYSGETEESLSVFLDAFKRGCMITCLSSGGKLEEYADKLGVPRLRVPSGMAPRATLPYLFVPLTILLEKLGLVKDVDSEISETLKVLKRIGSENSPDEPLVNNFSKSLASSIDGTVPVVYGFGAYRAVAQRFKTQFNENSKIPAKWEIFPELDHNEIVGWEAAQRFAKCFSVIFLRDPTEAKGIRERIEVTKELVQKVPVQTHELWSKGKSSLTKMSSVINIGDFTSVYLAVMQGIDPTPVKTIDLLKEKIKRSGLKEKTINELQNLVR